jgi:hypothetical protein
MRQPQIITCIRKPQEIPKNYLNNEMEVEQLEIKSL